MEQMITCINCPVGCRMTVQLNDEGQFVSVSGNTCARGAAYARQECTAPRRMITAVIPVTGSPIPLSVKTADPIPKELIPEIMQVLGQTHPQLPIHAGDIIVQDVLQTGINIIATRSLC